MQNMSKWFKWNQQIYNYKWSSLKNSQRNWLPVSKFQYVIWNIKCITKKKHIFGKKIGDNAKRFIFRINQHISHCKTGAPTCKVPS